MGNCPDRPCRGRNDNIFWIIILILLLGEGNGHNGCGGLFNDNFLIIIIIILLFGQNDGLFGGLFNCE